MKFPSFDPVVPSRSARPLRKHNNFRKLVKRGNAIIREWHGYEGMDENCRLMIAAISSHAVFHLNHNGWTPQQIEDNILMLRIALTTAFQIGRTYSREEAECDAVNVEKG